MVLIKEGDCVGRREGGRDGDKRRELNKEGMEGDIKGREDDNFKEREWKERKLKEEEAEMR